MKMILQFIGAVVVVLVILAIAGLAFGKWFFSQMPH